MSDDAQVDEVIQQLETAFGMVIRDCFGTLPPMLASYTAARLCETLREELRGMRVTVPAKPKFNATQIEADWHAGMTLRQVMAKHGCSQGTAYRYHPCRRQQAA